MTNPVHLLSVAALLLVAFLVGAVAGTLVRLLVLRLGQKPAAIAALAEATPVGPPLVAAPVIAPLPVAPTPVAPPPAEVPVPDFAATMIALANEAPPPAFLEATKPRTDPLSTPQPLPEASAVPVAAPLPAAEPMQPAHVAGETTSGIHVSAPLHENPPEPIEPSATLAEQRTADVIPFPTVSPEPPASRPTDIVVGGEAVAIVDTADLVVPEPAVAEPAAVSPPAVVAASRDPEPAPDIAHEDNFLFVGVEDLATPDAVLVPAVEADANADTIPVPVIAANAAVEAVATVALPVPEVVVTPTVVAAQPAVVAPPSPASVEPVAEATALEPAAEQPAAAIQPEPPVEKVAVVAAGPEPIILSLEEPMDEDAAMRAIEGNWSPRRTPAKRPAPAIAQSEGANQAVAASGRAVTAARRTAEAVVAEVAEVAAEAGRPAGLDAPRDGRKDDLTHIIGVLPVIETALNKLGVYHFDQVSALTDENIGWIEKHLGVPGRISRELWREQARELSAVLKPRRAAES